nr:hypothetical protein [Nocardiopsis lucentensis]
MRAPNACAAPTASANRTGSRTWRTQYSAVLISPGRIGRPVTVEMIGRVGSR